MQAGGTEPFEPELSSKRPDDSTVRRRLRESAGERRRFGYRPLGWLLVREGHVMNRKKLYRIFREEKPMVRRRGRRKRAIGTRAPLALPDAINRRWSLDFVSDALSDGRRFRIFCVVDDFSRECLATAAVIADDHCWRSARGHQTLQFAHHAHATDRGIDHRGQTFAAKIVHYAEDPETAAITEGIGHEVE